MLSFTNPAALWLLLLLIPLILLYLLKRKRKEIVVPSTLLWKQAVEDLSAQKPFQKLRSSVLLLLQILILVLITAILSGPQLSGNSERSQKWIMVLDTSASMQATDIPPSRFSAAKQQLFKRIDDLPQADEVLILKLSSEASVVQAFSRNPMLIHKTLQNLECDDVGANWQQLWQVLSPLLREKPQPRVVIASDFSNFPVDWKQRVPRFEAVAVGTDSRNLGITRAVLKPVPEDLKSQELFYQVRNYGTETRSIQVELKIDENVFDAYETTLPAHQSLDRNLQISITSPSRIDLKVEPADPFLLDNSFVLLAEPLREIPVRLAALNPFLEKAIKSLPNARLEQESAIVISSGLKINENQPGIYFIREHEQDCAGVVEWNASHPVLRFVEAGLWQFSKCTLLTVPASATILIEAEQGPIGYALDKQRRRQVVIGILPEESNLVLLGGFPILLQNSIEWIDEGLHQKLTSITGGAYKKEGPIQEGNRSGYVNFADALESDITPSHPSAHSDSATVLYPKNRDLSKWILILVTGLVMLEWWAFHRKVEL